MLKAATQHGSWMVGVLSGVVARVGNLRDHSR